MKKFSIIFFMILAVLACQRKTIAESEIILSNKTTPTEKNKPAKIPLNATASEPAKQGSIVYANRCGRCHELKPAAKFTGTEWKNILKSMIPKAKLNDTEAQQVSAYVMEHAKK